MQIGNLASRVFLHDDRIQRREVITRYNKILTAAFSHTDSNGRRLTRPSFSILSSSMKALK